MRLATGYALLTCAVLATACAVTEPAAPSDDAVAGNYETVLPAASGGGERQVTVILERNGSAVVTSAFSGRPSRFLMTGAWERSGDRITVGLTGPRAERLVFTYRQDRLIA